MDIPSLTAIFQKQLQDIESQEWDTIKRSQKAIILCRKALSELKNIIRDKGFDSDDQEIEFFKVNKQIPLSNLIYYQECYAFEAHFPKIGKKQQQKYISKAKDNIQIFFARHAEFINYIEQGYDHMDTWYFTRPNNRELQIIPIQDYSFDKDFSTPYDFLLGKLKAYKRFINYLEIRFENKASRLNLESLSEQYNLTWTSSKVALTELIYALYYSRAINHGNTDKKEIVMAFQKIFNFDLGDFYKTLSEIKSRKKSRTRFLDELSMGFIYEMEKSEL
ncbi:RteC domain-containing protein [Seonamhaeicola aphaedonensis]|uniref:RteC protein n=1 Tax=Seonamhaeicola aphaedonensis TaxID=1461338 RepID=A0A3D9H843_9FLAO|nr:RteC domain-containing protein [Seonamhaeicola aphaedonensis]RED45664.1 RteC protein [Seonamhaeicola aphaedonensis]